MTQYIDKSALVVEIEKRLEELSQLEKASYEIGLYDAYKIVLSFIDTLEVKEVQEDPVSEDLEYASEKYACRFSSSKYGYDKIKVTFKAGAKWQKEKLMKDAMYGLVCGHDESSPAWIDLNLLNKPNVKVGAEVKLIIIKDK